jgi:hypothetical protein
VKLNETTSNNMKAGLSSDPLRPKELTYPTGSEMIRSMSARRVRVATPVVNTRLVNTRLVNTVIIR